MAAPLDFSDLTGKKKKPLHQQITQQTNAQGFYSPDKIPEEKKQPQPGGMGYPTQQTQAGDELIKTMLRVANGRLTCAEALGHREFVMTKLYRSA